MLAEVHEFHRAFGLPCPDRPTDPDVAHRNLRLALMVEEFREFEEAHADRDLVEMADALADMAYIACGTAVAYGIKRLPAEDLLRTFFPSNNPPEIGDDNERESFTLAMSRCFHGYKAAEERALLGDVSLAIVAVRLDDLLREVIMMASFLNLPLPEVFAEVHRSNMAKLGPDGVPLRRADGKVLKPSGWQAPDIAGVLARATP